MVRFYEIFIGLRHLRSRKRNGFLSAITGISVGAVAIGVAALIVVISVMAGFEDDLKQKILGTNAHGVVLKYGTDFVEYREAADKVRAVEGVTGASPFSLNECMISSESNISGMVLKGIDVDTVNQVNQLGRYITLGGLDFLQFPERIPQVSPQDLDDRPQPGLDKPLDRFPERARDEIATDPTARRRWAKVFPGLLIGQEMARALKVTVGDRVNVVNPLGDLGPTGPVPRSKTFRVAGIFFSGMYEYDMKYGYITLELSQQFFDLGESATGLDLTIADLDDTKQTMAAVTTALGGFPFRTKDWGEMNQNLFSALQLEKVVMFLLLTIIIFVASFLILVTLVMLVLDKQKDIAILKSMGASDGGVLRLFMFEGSVIGLFGTLLGAAVGYGLCLFVRHFGVRLDPEVYYIEFLPVQIDPETFVVVSLTALVLTFLATIYPSLQAARLSPVEGLRYE